VSEHNDTALALEVLRRALRLRRPRPGLLHHSDRGSPYASECYRAELRASGMLQSMSRKGDCWDNSVAESFFATLRVELVDHARYATREAAMRFHRRLHRQLLQRREAPFPSTTSTPSNSNCDRNFNSAWHSHAVHENG
jgi:transposase InsO family protein